MGEIFVRFGGWLIIILLLLSPVPAGAKEKIETTAPLQVEGIRYGVTGGRTRIIVDFNKKTDFRAFLLDNPYRIVLDLPSSDWRTAKSKFITNDLLKAYRSGALEGGLTRVIFDLRKPAMIDNAFFIAKDSFNHDRLALDIKAVSRNAFMARLEDVQGQRDLKAVPADKKQQGLNSLTAARPVTPRAPSSPVTKAPSKNSLQKSDKKYTIVVDAGHGGEDPGALGVGGVQEKTVTLAVSQELKRQLEETGRYKVVLTRDRDVYIKLRERVAISRKVKGDLFVSIHADKVDRKGVRGASIYTLSEKASDEESARLADQENNSGFVAGVDLGQESADVADILLDLAMREKMNESNLFSRFLTNSFLRKNVRLLLNSHRSAGFAVLKAPDVPSVLIETGFLSNQDESKLLSSNSFHRSISAAIVEGIDGYFRKIEALQRQE
jgi:N-acetylmuramoyl-L-alanine amidase